MKPAPEATTRSRILDAALELFASQGFAGASMRQIAAAAGMRASSLYNHFDGKAAILAALIETYGPARGADRLASPAYRALADDPDAFCRRYAADWLDQWCDVHEQRFMALVTSDHVRVDEHRAQLVETLFEREVVAMADYFRGFSLRGRHHVPDAMECARLFMGGLYFVRMQHLLMPPNPSPREAVAEAIERTVRNFLHLVAPRDPT